MNTRTVINEIWQRENGVILSSFSFDEIKRRQKGRREGGERVRNRERLRFAVVKCHIQFTLNSSSKLFMS